jgi:phosphoenolpyruvate carboxykinase (GTP)
MTQNKAVLNWIDEMTAMTKPDKIVWIDGSEEQLEALRAEACSTGEMYKLNQEKLPGCYYHRTAVNDVARVEDRTFICTPTQEEAGPTNNWVEPSEMYDRLNKLYDGAMKGRTCYVLPYSMGPVGSPFAKYGIELTDSIYVVLNMNIMTRIGNKVLEALGDSPDFIKGLHAKKDLDAENRYIVHFPQDNAIYSINSGYGGNVLLGKNASLCALLPIWDAMKAGWLSICLF